MPNETINKLPVRENLKKMKIVNPTSKTQLSRTKLLNLIISLIVLTLSISNKAMAQEKNQMVRLVKIKIDPSQLDNYNMALKEQMTTAVRVEPGVLTYYAVADKSDPSNISILEIYADTAAYKSHIETAHFKKYKNAVKDIVKSLEIIDVSLIGSAKKTGL